ncbi:MAG: hydroxyacylglutathione hydrolase [Pseudomonadota bacterium]
MQINITPIPALSDNYIWAMHRTSQPYCLLVDPGEATPALAWLEQHRLEPVAILLTHHHYDHVNGVDELATRFELNIYGPDDERMPKGTVAVAEGETVEIPGLELRFDVLEVPAHTRSHIAFYGHDLVFCGDTLFSAGCGRLFEGTPDQMQAAMDKLAALPGDTKVYCGHEYTQSNCRFALKVEPDNPALRTRAKQVDALRARHQVTLPTTIAEECSFNPFMRTREAAVIDAAARYDADAAQSPEAVLGAIRRWKDAG